MYKTYFELAKANRNKYKYPIVLAKNKSQLHELADPITENVKNVAFITTGDTIGARVYQRSLLFLFVAAADEIVGRKNINVMFALGDALYIEINNFNNDLCEKISSKMKDLIKSDTKFVKRRIDIKNAIDYFEDEGLKEKGEMLLYRRTSSVCLYYLNSFADYCYGDLVYSTGVLKYFEILPYKNGLLLCYPNIKNPDTVCVNTNHDKLFNVLYKSQQWARSINTKTVGDLNTQMVNCKMDEIILTQEAKAEREIASIANDIANNHKKFVLIAGPSSSGKTSFSNRLAIQLNSLGYRCHTIAQDDYFLNRDQIPFDANGKQNFESIDVVDLKLFDSDMNALIGGERVEIPHFNFISGEREYKGKHFVQLGPNDIVIIEGIHCLNPRFLPSVNPYRIYISALTAISLDEHNRISASDMRMLRRMARDIKHRGASPQKTIAGWVSVRRGEEENIFPYQENADVIFNSSLIYELPLIKTLVEPMLFSVPRDSDEWIEAKRMLKFLDFSIGYTSNVVPKNSILQEFLGGSCFDVG